MTPEQLAKSGTEDAEQMAVFAWAATSKLPNIKWMHAIPNGGKRDARTGAKMKATGVKPGVPDIHLPLPLRGFAGLYIELKRRKTDLQAKGTIAKEQREWHEYLTSVGYRVAVCYGWEEARDVILSYYNGGPEA